ncbi:hypothetical protein SAY87_027293 [Trapa incisa]|uniref:Protein kinase domain-containing protein n=1 Tax=Trapa incisa TaxID=236973 RepID=A0AAN7JLN7_9MYRT|nr:hypothetical protein SAY87_027293 [Trapa incisa]
MIMSGAFSIGMLSAFAVLLFLLVDRTEQLQSSQAQTLSRIQHLLNNPSVLSSWNDDTDFCNVEPNSSLTVVCYEDTVTQLHIIGEKGTPQLPENFSMDSFITTLVKLPNLKVLKLVSLGLWGPLSGKIARLSSLEIFNVSSNLLSGPIPKELSSLMSLQTMILDGNAFSGQLPHWIGQLQDLTVLSLQRNSFNGSLPSSLGDLNNLRVLSLSHNGFFGPVPDLSRLTNLQVLDLEDNSLDGPFPKMSNKLISIILKKNKFRSGIPAGLSTYYQLQLLDLSSNTFVGPFLQQLLALPSINYIDIAGNKFTGLLSENLSCNKELMFVDLSSNLLTGHLPDCLLNLRKVDVRYAGNCLSTGDQDQQPVSFCRNEALAVGILPSNKNQKRGTKTIVALGISGGTIGGIALVGLAFLLVRRNIMNKPSKTPPTRLILETVSTGYTSKILSDARYIHQTMNLGSIGLPAYRTFSLEEIGEATGNFDSSVFMGEGSHGQMYRGQLKNGSLVAIRCLKMKKSRDVQNFMHHIELISKLRHPHVVSALGHCFECHWDDTSVGRIFLIFEYVPNGTLGTWLSGGRSRQLLTWAQRIAAAIGIAKGIQFLHTGIIPGLYSNNLKISDILLDQNLIAKISSYNLPLMGENSGKDGNKSKKTASRVNHADRNDIYELGVIILELMVGQWLKTKSEIDAVKDQVQLSLAANQVARRSIIDPAIQRASSDQSLRTMMEISLRCLQSDPADQPSVEDVLWNLQFASQVQNGWRDSHSSEYSQSPGSPS